MQDQLLRIGNQSDNCLTGVNPSDWVDLVWFGFAGFFLNASLEPRRRAQKRNPCAEANLAHHVTVMVQFSVGFDVDWLVDGKFV